MTEHKEKSSLPKLGRNTPHKQRSLKQHLKRRLIILIPVLLLMIFITRTDIGKDFFHIAEDKITFNNLSWFNNSALTAHVRALIAKQNLAHNIPHHCLVPWINNGDESNNTPEMDIFVRHGNGCPPSDPSNPKAPPSADLLFHVKINRTLHIIETDAGSLGRFYPIQSK